ncbi:alpha/beta fold hydrolase [Nonomuraea endophytica]|uniref:Pimeloyl-ACP methyl ester carboxylesterase n=1 Tax=Nonomuraea endophytica TaxID=714136 RepID=A0A7W8A2K3_9ACTN|nr:alpha/beta fold hydrolase [Nonomuraea endophytica]MBB5078328.1 pimeloyl-ACP methyl ester carboxylesterase [Nonomuraea endophytica]
MIIRVVIALALSVPPPAAAVRAADACPVPVPTGTTCGFLEVPERRDAPGRTIKVGYAVHRSQDPARKPDPVVYMGGGPASSSLQLTGFLSQVFPDRDVVTIEQRGGKYSQPRLTCPETVEAMLDRLRRPETGAAAVATGAVACRKRLAERGVDLRGYNTREIVADVVDLRKKLGYPTWNLFGVSYSTRVMVEAAKADPGGVRSMILDSYLPEKVDWYREADRNLIDTVTALGVKDRFEAMVSRYNRAPALVPTTDPLLGEPFTARMSGDDVATVLAEALHESELVAVAPALIDALASGHEELLRPLADAVGGGLTSHEFGLYHAVQCQDETKFPDFSRLFTVTNDKAVCQAWNLPPSPPTPPTGPKTPEQTGSGQDSSGIGQDGQGSGQTDPATTRADLGAGQSRTTDAGAGQSRTTDAGAGQSRTTGVGAGRPGTTAAQTGVRQGVGVPVLVLGGQFDPTTPPRTSRPAAAELPGVTFVEFAGVGHAVFLAMATTCGRQTMAAFVAAPGSWSQPCVPSRVALERFAPGSMLVTGAPYQIMLAPWLAVPMVLFALVALVQLVGGGVRGRGLSAFAGLAGLAAVGLTVQAVYGLLSTNETALAVGVPSSVEMFGWLAVGAVALSVAAAVWAIEAKPARRLWPHLVALVVGGGFLVWWFAWFL